MSDCCKQDSEKAVDVVANARCVEANAEIRHVVSSQNELASVDFKEASYRMRSDIKAVTCNLNFVRKNLLKSGIGKDEVGAEMIANVTLAYRALEDAAMRLGKAIQANDGGTSCYPR